MGVAVLDGNDLVHYAVRSFRDKRPADELIRATRDAVNELIAAYQPSVLAYEKTFFVQSKNSALLHVQESEIKRVGRVAQLRVIGFAPTRVRSLLCSDGRATKMIVAKVLAERFPELEPYRVQANPIYQKYWLNMFDAVAVAVVSADAIAVRKNTDRLLTAA